METVSGIAKNMVSSVFCADSDRSWWMATSSMTDSEKVFHGLTQHLRREWLLHVPLGAERHHLFHTMHAAVGRDHQHGNDPQHLVGFHAAHKLLAVHDRHVDVSENDIDPVRAQQVQRLLAVGGLDASLDIQSRKLDDANDERAHRRRIVHHHGMKWHRYSSLKVPVPRGPRATSRRRGPKTSRSAWFGRSCRRSLRRAPSRPLSRKSSSWPGSFAVLC